MRVKRLVFTAILAAFALVSFVIEMQIPPLTPIYGIKLGVANVFTLFALYALGRKEALSVLVIRLALGTIFAGQVLSFIYSLCGGFLAFLVMILLKKFFPKKQMWALSAVAAVAHNIGQIIAAIFITGTIEIAFYLPVLVISGIIAGVLTGLCAQTVLLHIDKLR